MPERTMQITAGAAAAKKHSKKQLALRAVGDDSDDEPHFAPGEFVGGINAPRDANAYASAESSSDDEALKAPRKTAKASTSAQAGRRLGGNFSDEDGAGVGAGAGKGKAKAKPTKKPFNTSSPAKPKAKAKAYCPRVQTGGWAILVGLCAFGSGKWKSQDEIVVVADPFYGKAGQSLNDKGTGSGPQQFITAWKSVSPARYQLDCAEYLQIQMKKLIDEGLVEKKSRNPVLYQLTYDGKRKPRYCRKCNLMPNLQAGRWLVEPVDMQKPSSEKLKSPATSLIFRLPALKRMKAKMTNLRKPRRGKIKARLVRKLLKRRMRKGRGKLGRWIIAMTNRQLGTDR